MAKQTAARKLGSSVRMPARRALDGRDNQLKKYWTQGEGAAKIRWQEPGAFERCMSHLGKYFPQNTGGLCRNYFVAATGIEPGTLAHGGEGRPPR
jgi:hypothetical protein